MLLAVETPSPSFLEGSHTLIRVCLAGATGWAGSELARGIARTTDVSLVAAVARRHAGKVLGDVLNEPLLTSLVYASAADALARCGRRP